MVLRSRDYEFASSYSTGNGDFSWCRHLKSLSFKISSHLSIFTIVNHCDVDNGGLCRWIKTKITPWLLFLFVKAAEFSVGVREKWLELTDLKPPNTTQSFVAQSHTELVGRLVWGLSGKADTSWKRGEFIVEVSLSGPTHTLPGHLLIQLQY